MTHFPRTLLIAVLASTMGCALTDAHLDVSYDPAMAARGPISRSAIERVTVAPFEDERPDPERIGYKRNSYGMKTADILTERPVTELVQEAFVQAVEHNGLTVGEDGDIVVQGAVTKFWIDFDIGMWTVKFLGSAECDVTFADGSTGETIHEGSYFGSYEKEAGGGWTGTWTEVMILALHDMIDSIVKDPELTAALREHATPSAEDVGEDGGEAVGADVEVSADAPSPTGDATDL